MPNIYFDYEGDQGYTWKKVNKKCVDIEFQLDVEFQLTYVNKSLRTKLWIDKDNCTAMTCLVKCFETTSVF